MTRRCAAALALAWLLTSCTVASGPNTASTAARASTRTASTVADRWRTVALDDRASVTIPTRWHTTKYRGAIATVYFPLSFVGDDPFTGPCSPAGSRSTCTTRNWFADNWRTPVSGVVARWSHAEFPTPVASQLAGLPGRRDVIDRRVAKIWSGPATAGCPAGAHTELDASVTADAQSRSNGRYDLTACLGPAVTAPDRTAVRRMLLSLRITG